MASESSVRGSSIAVLQAAALALKDGVRLGPDDERAVFDAMQRYVEGIASARLEQAGRRWAAKDPRIASLIRERQDLVSSIVQLDRRITAGLTNADRAPTALSAERAEFATLLARQRVLEDGIRSTNPSYFDLLQPRPLSIAETQALLRDDEVAVTTVVLAAPVGHEGPDPDLGLVLAITRTEHRLLRMAITRNGMEDGVQTLRCGLDASAWSGPIEFSRKRTATCFDLVGRGPMPNGELPFDLTLAHRLHQAIFGGISDLVAGRHLLMISTYPMANVPWQVLVRSAPPTRFAGVEALRTIDWLGHAAPITVVPSPSSLRVLRSVASTSRGTKPWIGFGNPLLNGPDDRYLEVARLARERRQCGTLADPRAEIARLSRAVHRRDGGGMGFAEQREGYTRMNDLNGVRSWMNAYKVRRGAARPKLPFCWNQPIIRCLRDTMMKVVWADIFRR